MILGRVYFTLSIISLIFNILLQLYKGSFVNILLLPMINDLHLRIPASCLALFSRATFYVFLTVFLSTNPLVLQFVIEFAEHKNGVQVCIYIRRVLRGGGGAMARRVPRIQFKQMVMKHYLV